jgi:outer membrane murein-binding lipoprotein Lpp
MNNKPVILAAILAGTLAVSACTDLKPLEGQVAELRSSVERLSSENAQMKQAVDAATQSASQASQAAQAAATEANRANAAAQASQQCCDANTERMDRMFRRSVSK